MPARRVAKLLLGYALLAAVVACGSARQHEPRWSEQPSDTVPANCLHKGARDACASLNIKDI